MNNVNSISVGRSRLISKQCRTQTLQLVRFHIPDFPLLILQVTPVMNVTKALLLGAQTIKRGPRVRQQWSMAPTKYSLLSQSGGHVIMTATPKISSLKFIFVVESLHPTTINKSINRENVSNQIRLSKNSTLRSCMLCRNQTETMKETLRCVERSSASTMFHNEQEQSCTAGDTRRY